MFISAMTVHNENFFATVSGHLVGRLLQQIHLHMRAVGDSAGLMLRFENLAEIIFGENDSVFLLRRMQRDITNIDQIGAERQLRSMFFENSKWQHTSALALLDAAGEIGSS